VTGFLEGPGAVSVPAGSSCYLRTRVGPAPLLAPNHTPIPTQNITRGRVRSRLCMATQILAMKRAVMDGDHFPWLMSLPDVAPPSVHFCSMTRGPPGLTIPALSISE
jgi:hypothetical protein